MELFKPANDVDLTVLVSVDWFSNVLISFCRLIHRTSHHGWITGKIMGMPGLAGTLHEPGFMHLSYGMETSYLLFSQGLGLLAQFFTRLGKIHSTALARGVLSRWILHCSHFMCDFFCQMACEPDQICLWLTSINLFPPLPTWWLGLWTATHHIYINIYI